MSEAIDKLNSLSVFFPLYNEGENVKELVDSALLVFPNVTESLEILLINDGSTDNTRTIAERCAQESNYVRVVNQENRGYGGAVKRGFIESRFEWVFFSDGDLQFDLNEFYKLIPLSAEADLVIGYRKKRADGFKRVLIARMLKLWNLLFLGFPLFVKDTDCAFKLISKEVLDSLGELRSDGAMMTTELLLKAYKKGYRFKQVGVSHYPRKRGSQTGDNAAVIRKAISDTFMLRRLLKQVPHSLDNM